MTEFRPLYRSLVDIYLHCTGTYPDRRLFGVKRDGAFQWSTYREFEQAVTKLRGGFAKLGVTKGDRVAVIANNRPEWAEGAFASYTLGAAYVPMYEAQLDKEWKYILGDSGAKMLLASTRAIYDRVVAMKAELPALEHVVLMDRAADDALTFDRVKALGDENPAPVREPDPKDTAAFIYTSGTTGNPKGVILSHGNIASNISAILSVFPLERQDCSLSFLPWAHSFGQVVELYALMSLGGALGIAESVDKIVANLAEVKPTVLMSVPRIFNRIYEGVQKKMEAEGGLKKKLFDETLKNANLRRKLAEEGKTSVVVELKYAVLDRLVAAKVRERFGGNLRYAISGGAAIAREVAEFIDNLGITVFEGYGLTETSPIATANWPGSRKIGSVGRAIPGVRIEVDPAGEIIVYGHNVMQGYHKLPEENAKVFTADGGFRTGDMGFVDKDGFVFITGRIKEQYKLENGKYVAPVPLEEQLKLSPYISNVMVYGDNRPFNVALVVADMESLRAWARSHGVAASGDDALLHDARVRALMEQEIEKHSSEFKQFERVKAFALIGEDFTTQNDMLTPSLKLKRRVVMKTHGDRLAALYSQN